MLFLRCVIQKCYSFRNLAGARVSDPLNELEWAEDTDTRLRLLPRPDGAGRLELPPPSLYLSLKMSTLPSLQNAVG